MSRGYYITRLSAPGEPIDPCAPLTFYPPKGSDELHEALKASYPFETSLSSRMRQAVIDFLMAEQQQDQFMESPISSTNQMTPEYLPSPQSSFVSTMPSPAISGYASFNSTSLTDAPAEPAPLPAQQDLMTVWNLPSKPDAKIHTRRAMTAEEKKAYKQKRIVGACADCKRRRRKVGLNPPIISTFHVQSPNVHQCEHNSVGSMSPPASTSRKVTKRKKSSATTSTTSFAASVVTRHAETSFQTQQNSSFADFDMADFSGDMIFDVNTDFKLDNPPPEFDLGFDLDIDFPLFPEVPYSSGNMGSAILPTWQDVNAGLDIPVQQDVSFQSAYANRPLNHVIDTWDLPLTPQSLETSPMWRTQSGNTEQSGSFVSSGTQSADQSTTASQSSAATPMSRNQSGSSISEFASRRSSALAVGTQTASSHIHSGSQSESPTLSETSYSYVDPQVLYGPSLSLERSDQQQRSTVSMGNGSREVHAACTSIVTQDGFGSHLPSSGEIPTRSQPQVAASRSRSLPTRQQPQQLLLTTEDSTGLSSRTSTATHVAQGDTVLPSGVPGRSPTRAKLVSTSEDRERDASGPGYYAATSGSVAILPALPPPAEFTPSPSPSRDLDTQRSLSMASVQARSSTAEDTDSYVEARNSSVMATIPLYPRSPQSPRSGNGDQDKFLRLLAPAQSAPINLPLSREVAGGSNLCASLLVLACLTQFSTSKGASLSRKDAQFVLQHLQDVKPSSVLLLAFAILGALFVTCLSSSSSFFREASYSPTGSSPASILASWLLPAVVAVLCFPSQVNSLGSFVREVCRPSHLFKYSTSQQANPRTRNNPNHTLQHNRHFQLTLTKPLASLLALVRRSMCNVTERIGRQGQRVLL
jgi:hypothetical protein